MVFGSTSSPMSPRSIGPGASTWMKGAPGNGMKPPGIGAGDVSVATAEPGSDRTSPRADARVTKTNDPRRLIDIPPLAGQRPVAPENDTNRAPTCFGCQAEDQ